MSFGVFGLSTGQDPNFGTTLYMFAIMKAFYFLFLVRFFPESIQTRFSSNLTKGGPILFGGVP